MSTPSSRGPARGPSRAPLVRAAAAFIVVAVSLYLALTTAARLGLDLEGGTQIVLETQDGPRIEANAESTDRALEILRGRVDSLGVAEPTLTRSGENRIIIELPGEQDPTQAEEVIGKTAQLTFHSVLGQADEQALNKFNETREPEPAPDDEQEPAEPAEDEPAEDDPADELEPIDTTEPAVVPSDQGDVIRVGPARLDGDDVTDALAATPQDGVGEWVVNVEFGGGGAGKWQQITEDALQAPDGSPERRIAILLDNEIITSPNVIGPQGGPGQSGGSTEISGGFSQADAEDLALLIKGGALPVPVEIIELRTVGPTLGADAIDASFEAAIIGIILTGIFIVLIYRLVGVMATVALASYAVISFAMLVVLGATLTLPGLAGFVLAIGMAIDANVLIFERAREEYTKRRGEGLASALDTGYRKAWSAIIDSNITTLLAGALLFFFASGPVKGFGVTLSIGVIASMISALVIARVLTDFLVRRSFVKNRPHLTGLAGDGKLRTRLNNSKVRLMDRSGMWLGVAVAIVLVAIAGTFVRGMNLGVEFTGGRVLEFSTTQPISVDDAREAVSDIGFPQAVVQESTGTNEGTENITVRTDKISTSEAQDIEATVAELGEDVTKQRDELIGPTLGEELRNKAIIAFLIAVAAQMLYLAFRFRWTWAIAAALAMVHDVLAVVGVFAWWDKPIDGVFLAAVLSIIGLSVNDTIVVFDRIRERVKLEPGRKLSNVGSEALLQTLPRTINTGLGAMFILGALAILGGSSLRDFSYALLIGLSFGIFSSVFVASPIAIWLEHWKPARVAEEKRKQRVIDPYADVVAAGRESGEV